MVEVQEEAGNAHCILCGVAFHVILRICIVIGITLVMLVSPRTTKILNPFAIEDIVAWTERHGGYGSCACVDIYHRLFSFV